MLRFWSNTHVHTHTIFFALRREDREKILVSSGRIRLTRYVQFCFFFSVWVCCTTLPFTFANCFSVLEKPVSPGDLVMARWRGYKTFFRGRVLKVFRPKTQIEQEMLDIEYDDGQLEVNMSCERLCLLSRRLGRVRPSAWHDACILNCGMLHSCVWHNACTRETWRIPMIREKWRINPRDITCLNRGYQFFGVTRTRSIFDEITCTCACGCACVRICVCMCICMSCLCVYMCARVFVRGAGKRHARVCSAAWPGGWGSEGRTRRRVSWYFLGAADSRLSKLSGLLYFVKIIEKSPLLAKALFGSFRLFS